MQVVSSSPVAMSESSTSVGSSSSISAAGRFDWFTFILVCGDCHKDRVSFRQAEVQGGRSRGRFKYGAAVRFVGVKGGSGAILGASFS